MREFDDIRRNYLLRSLIAAGCKNLHSHLELMPLAAGKVLYDSGAPLRHVYFPTTAIVSKLYIMENGTSDEIAAVGHEGFIGLQLFLGRETTPSRALVRSTGHAFRLDANLLQKEFNQSVAVQSILLHYMQSLLAQMAQTAACDRHHSIRQRLCRWLLLSFDRLSSNDLHATHESIGELLNVRRESITQQLGELQAAGLLRCQRGQITVIDRLNLEARACACYRGIRKELSRLLTVLTDSQVKDGLEECPHGRTADLATRARFDAVAI